MTETMFQPIRIMLVANHPMVCRGLETFLKVFDYLQMVGRAESGEAAILLCAEVLPDVILIDLDMELLDMDGFTATRVIHQKFPQVLVIALASFKDGELIKRDLEDGVIGYLLKDVSADQIAQAILAATWGYATISAQAVQALVELLDPSPELHHELIECDREALALMINGLEVTQVAGNLTVSPSFIEMQVAIPS